MCNLIFALMISLASQGYVVETDTANTLTARNHTYEHVLVWDQSTCRPVRAVTLRNA